MPGEGRTQDTPRAVLLGGEVLRGDGEIDDEVGDQRGRQIRAGEVSDEGAVLLIGAGGLGSPLAMYLAAAGVGEVIFDSLNIILQLFFRRVVLQAGHGRAKIPHYREW